MMQARKLPSMNDGLRRPVSAGAKSSRAMNSTMPTLPKSAIKPIRSGANTSTAPAAMARYWTCIPLSVPSMKQMTKMAV